MCLGGCLHLQRLVRAPVIVELYPVADYPYCMLLGFETVPVCTLLLQGSDHALHHAVLVQAVRRDELLLQAIAPHQACVVPAGECQAIVRAQQEGVGTRPKVP